MRAGRATPEEGPPREINQLPLERQQCIFVRKENALVLGWQDEDVTVLTTKCKADMVKNVREYFGKYNQKMGSVDKACQFLEPYDINWKTLTWFKKTGIHFIL